MKIEQDEFYKLANKLFDTYNSYKSVTDEVEKALKNRNVLPIETRAILSRNIPVETVNNAIIYHILKNLYLFAATNKEIGKNDYLLPSELNPERFFTEFEIKDFEQFKKEVVKNEDRTVTFDNVIRINEDQFVTTLTAQQIADLYNRNLIYYNKQTQRNTIFKNGVEQINISNKSVREITEDMLNNKFISNYVTFNVLQDSTEEIKYDEMNQVLIIEKGEIDIIDGFHRNLGILNALKENPQLNLVMGVTITNFNIDKAKRFITQEDKKNKIDKRYIQSLNSDRLSNLIVKKLNENPECELHNKITTDLNLIRMNRALVLFTTISDAIEYNFELKTKKDVSEISKFLLEGFNILMGSFPDEFINDIGNTKSYSVINDSNMFIGYIALFSSLYNTKNWEDKIFVAMNSIDFLNNNPIWKEIGLYNKTINKPTIKKISNYFKDMVK